MTHLLVAGRRLKLLGDEATEHLEGLLSLRFRKDFPEVPQNQRRARR
jgi:hypothetical protein